ncbi:unnamed protein product [Darwinula stevensoni]|uniref:DM2 domain-containing protein n=1 Tax=Darwinula stevensoni TaxID=69355 RepID=A0A7R9A191_9CRUS|nr:unnamed protein product [Darwinula stevensoni]CAG0882965.1 unnamed protein product [Darwinula stevensoni]
MAESYHDPHYQLAAAAAAAGVGAAPNGTGDDSGEADKQKKAAQAKAAAPKKTTGRRETGFTKTYKLSPELAEIVGAEAMPRHEVVKRMWAIIKERNLYDPKNKQFAICDDQLLKVFGVKRFRTFGMMKFLKHHFLES